MSTDIITIKDRLKPDQYELQIYQGTGGIAFLAFNKTMESGTKIWLSPEDIEILIYELIPYTPNREINEKNLLLRQKAAKSSGIEGKT